jgi:hypothetical protein
VPGELHRPGHPHHHHDDHHDKDHDDDRWDHDGRWHDDKGWSQDKGWGHDDGHDHDERWGRGTWWSDEHARGDHGGWDDGGNQDRDHHGDRGKGDHGHGHHHGGHDHRAKGVEVWVNGVRQGVFAHTGRIIVLGLAGDDDIQIAGGLKNEVEFRGGDGDDRLKAGAGSALLLGGAGDDELIGGSGPDVLIGGAGQDRLVGGPGGDLLIAGSTIYDGDIQALCAIVHAWTGEAGYGARVARLTEGVNGVQLTAETVLDDGVQDRLTGSSGWDWFFATVEGKRRDKVTDRHHGERLTALEPLVPDPAPKPCKPVIDWDRDDDHHGGGRDGKAKAGWLKDFVLDLGGHDVNKDLRIVLDKIDRFPETPPAPQTPRVARHART